MDVFIHVNKTECAIFSYLLWCLLPTYQSFQKFLFDISQTFNCMHLNGSEATGDNLEKLSSSSL